MSNGPSQHTLVCYLDHVLNSSLKYALKAQEQYAKEEAEQTAIKPSTILTEASRDLARHMKNVYSAQVGTLEHLITDYHESFDEYLPEEKRHEQRAT